MYDPTSNGAEWIPVWGTVNDLLPMEDSSAWELNNITLLDSPEDILQMDQFGGVLQGACTCAPSVASCAGAAPHDEDKVMEQEPLEEERECHEYTEETDSSPWSSTDNYRYIEEADTLESGLQRSTESDRQTEGED